MSEDKPLRVSRLEATDVGGIREVKLNLDPQLTIRAITGPNGAGKTAILNSMEAVLCGKRHDPPEPIRQGAKRGRVELTLSDALRDRFSVAVEWHRKKDGGIGRTLVVTDLEQDPPARLAGPQSVLEKLLTAIAFDPLAFARADAGRRARMLMEAAGLTDAYDAKTGQIAAATERRRVLNGDVKRLEAQLSSRPDPKPGETLEEQSAADLQAALVALTSHNTERATVQARRDAGNEQMFSLGGQVAALSQNITGQEMTRDEHRVWLQEHPAIDTDEMERQIVELRRRLQDAEQHNTERRAKEMAVANLEANLVENNTRKAELVATAEELASSVRSDTEWLQEHPEHDTSAITQQMADLEEHNRLAREQQAHRQVTAELEGAADAAEAADLQVWQLRSDLQQLVSDSEIAQNIDSLAIDEEGTITINNLPLQSCSTSEAIRLSAHVGMCAHPQLRLMCIDEGAALDENSLAALAELAGEHEYDVWMTGVQLPEVPGMQTVQMEDGQVVE